MAYTIILKDNILIGINPYLVNFDQIVPGLTYIQTQDTLPNLDLYEWDISSQQFIQKVKSRELTKVQFRRLFTNIERYSIDTFNKTYETNENLTNDMKIIIASALEDYRVAEIINLDDPATISCLQLYVAVGILSESRLAEILS